MVRTFLDTKKKKLSARSKKRLNILKDHEIATLKSKLELQEKIHTKTLNEFARERRALEDKIREQRRVLEQILSKSKEDKNYYVKIVRTMQKNQDDEAWAPKLLLSEEEKQSWNSRIFKAPVKTIVGGEQSVKAPIHLPLNLTPENTKIWKRNPLILPNLIALNMFSEPGHNFLADVSNPSKEYIGLDLVTHGHPEKRTIMFHIRNEDNMELKRVKVYISFDGMCSRLWLTPAKNATKFNEMLLNGLETIHNRANNNDNSIVWDLVFTPGGRVSVEMVAGGGNDRIAMSPMKQVRSPLSLHNNRDHETEFSGDINGVNTRDKNIIYSPSNQSQHAPERWKGLNI